MADVRALVGVSGRTRRIEAADNLLLGAGLKGAANWYDLLGDNGGRIYNAGNISGATTLDVRNGIVQIATMTGDTTLQVLTNCRAGHCYKIICQQDATGGRHLALGAGFTSLVGTPYWNLCPLAYNVVDLVCITDGALMLLVSVSGAIETGFTGTGDSGIWTPGVSATLAGSVYCDEAIINAGIVIDCYQWTIFARYQIVLVDPTAKIWSPGSDGQPGAGTGAGGAVRGDRDLNVIGALGGNGNVGAGTAGSATATAFYTGTAGAGGAGAGGAGGAGGAQTLRPYEVPKALPRALFGGRQSAGGFGSSTIAAGAGGGGGNGAAAKGGGGGSGGGALGLVTPCVRNAGVISAPGGAGGAGDPAGNTGGGGGGIGGWVTALVRWWSGNAATAPGGAKGLKGGAGADGTDGTAGVVQILPLT